MTTYKVWNGTSWVYIDSQNYDARYVLTSSKGSNSGVASLDTSGHIPSEQLPSSIVGAVNYKGTFDPAGGVAPTPAAQGYYYVSSGAGTISATTFATGDWLVYKDASNWDKLQNSSASVTWSNVSNKPASYTPDVHDNTSHSVQYITIGGVTYEALLANDDVGTGATQVAAGNHTHSDLQPLDGDLTAIAGLAGSAGLLRKTAANTYELDTNTYITSLSTAPNATNWDTAARPSFTGNALKVLRLNSSATAFEFATGGVTAFTGLSDTPSDYVGQEGLFVRVNAGADALEFASVITTVNWGSISGNINLQGDLNLALAGKLDNGSQAYDSARLGGADANTFSTTGHNHNATYLGLTAKAADSNLLDGMDSTAFATVGHNHSATYQPLDNELTLLSALSLTGNESKYIRLNSGGTAFEFATVTSGGGTWGSITGTLSDQTDLQNILDTKLESTDLAEVGYSSVATTATLPTSPTVGDVYEFIGTGENWTLTANTGQYIRMLSVVSTSAGTIASTSGYDCVCMVYIGSNVWLVKSAMGVLEVT